MDKFQKNQHTDITNISSNLLKNIMAIQNDIMATQRIITELYNIANKDEIVKHYR